MTSYTFGANDTLQMVKQGAQTRAFVYDSLKRLISATNPESGKVSYTYDNAGNVATRTDARGVVTSNSYDALNRPAQTTYSGIGRAAPRAAYG